MNMHDQRGVTVMLVLVFMGIFLFLLGTILSYTLMQGRYGRALYAREQAVNVAEAGLEYYRWFLAHNPLIMEDGVGLVSPYTHEVVDPEGGRIGEAEVTATANLACGAVQWVDLTSVGTADVSPQYERILAARYMRPSVAEYSAFLNQNVWAGSDRVISGPYFSNGGIRMDGSHNSTVQSSQATWQCDSSFGCSPTQTKNGVWGAGSNPALWSWAPDVASFTFSNIGTEFSDMRTRAAAQGLLLENTRVRLAGVQQGSTHTSVGDSDERGYRLVFNSDNTVSVYRVTDTDPAWSKHSGETAWYNDYHTITAQTLKGTYAIPSGCSLIYSDAKLWIEGVIDSKVTVLAANSGAFNADIILQGNITYATSNGSSGFTAIAERSVLVPLVAPENMTVRGVYVAQTGYFGRNYYTTSGNNDVPESLNSYVLLQSMTTIGTVVSNGRIGTKWMCGSPGVYCSGFENRIDTYDRLLAFNPPPFTPASSADYELVLWREE